MRRFLSSSFSRFPAHHLHHLPAFVMKEKFLYLSKVCPYFPFQRIYLFISFSLIPSAEPFLSTFKCAFVLWPTSSAAPYPYFLSLPVSCVYAFTFLTSQSSLSPFQSVCGSYCVTRALLDLHGIQSKSHFSYTHLSQILRSVCVWETTLPPWHAFHVRGGRGKRVPLLATYKINKVVERKMPFIRMLVVCEDGGLTAPQNHLRRSCTARKPLKGRREVISVNHWDGGRSGHYPPTACSLIDSRCYIVHAVWSHGLFGRWLKGELGKRSGHLLFILHFYLWSIGGTKKLGELCLSQR